MAGRLPKELREGKPPGKPPALPTARGPAPTRLNRRYVEAVNRHSTGGVTYQLKPAAYAFIERLVSEGNDLSYIARALGVGESTFKAMRDRDPLLAEVMSTGIGVLSNELSGLLLKFAREGSVVAAIFLAKSRAKWSEDAGRAAAPTVNVQINLPAAADPSVILQQLPPEEPE